MRGASKKLPKYRKHRASGQAVVTLSGRDFYLGPHGTKASKQEYDRLIGEWLANERRLPKEKSEPMTISRVCAAYWTFCKTYYVKNGQATDEQAGVRSALKALKKRYGSTSAEDFGPLALEAVRDQMIATGNSRRYINQNIGRIKRMFRWAVSKELVPVEAYQRLQTVAGLKQGKSKAVERDTIMPVDEATVEATLPFMKPIVADMVRIQLLTGCRPGEICSMRPGEIDRNKKVWRYWPHSHKMEHKNRQRVILIGPRAQAILKRYLLRAEDQHCFQRKRGKGPFVRMFYWKQIQQACDKAFKAPEGIRRDKEKLKSWRKEHRWAPNRLRHSAGTRVRQEFGLEAAQTVLGHASADVTQVYAERDIAKAAEVMEKIG